MAHCVFQIFYWKTEKQTRNFSVGDIFVEIQDRDERKKKKSFFRLIVNFFDLQEMKRMRERELERLSRGLSSHHIRIH